MHAAAEGWSARCMVMKPGILISEGRLHRQSSSLKLSCRILRDMKVEAIESFQNMATKFFRGLQLLCQFKNLLVCKFSQKILQVRQNGTSSYVPITPCVNVQFVHYVKEFKKKAQVSDICNLWAKQPLGNFQCPELFTKGIRRASYSIIQGLLIIKVITYVQNCNCCDSSVMKKTWLTHLTNRLLKSSSG